MPRFGSEQEYEEQGEKRALLPEDWYLLEIKELTIKENQPNPYEKTEEFPAGKPRDTAFAKMRVISFMDGSPVVDVDGKQDDDRLAFDFLEIERMGFSGSGKPSKARKFTSSALGQDARQPIEFDSWGDLVGKRLYGHLMKKKNGKQGVDDYNPVRRRPSAAPAAPVSLPVEQPVAETDLQAKAQEIFGEEATF